MLLRQKVVGDQRAEYAGPRIIEATENDNSFARGHSPSQINPLEREIAKYVDVVLTIDPDD